MLIKPSVEVQSNIAYPHINPSRKITLSWRGLGPRFFLTPYFNFIKRNSRQILSKFDSTWPAMFVVIFPVITHVQRHLWTGRKWELHVTRCMCCEWRRQHGGQYDRKNRYFLRFGSIIRSKDRGIRYRAVRIWPHPMTATIRFWTVP